MKVVKIKINKGTIERDYMGFDNKSCELEDKAFNLLSAKMGVITHVEYSDVKREAEQIRAAQKEDIKI
jgi:hypothetical protein